MGRALLKDRGFTITEIILAMLMVSILVLGMASSLKFLATRSVRDNDKSFATQKALDMMEELRGVISASDASVSDLEAYDDGAGIYNPFLTIQLSTGASPGDRLSGNDRQVFARQVTVRRITNEPAARQVYVRVYKKSEQNPSQYELLAETMSVLRVAQRVYSPTQVFDLYILALENVPGWWVNLPSMRSMFEGIIQDLQNRNPGLELRVHWVTRLAYGRDPYYTPYVNKTTLANDTAPAGVYFYPGLVRNSNNTDLMYYEPDMINGRVNVDGTATGPLAPAQPERVPYSLADQYNHAVRYPEEVELYKNAVAWADANDRPAPEISLRMLLEKLYENDPVSGEPVMKNLLVLNLHGELLPMPPMRNYSDAAKDPENHPGVRVVAHPEQLEVPAGRTKLRVYSYAMNPDDWAANAYVSSVTVLIRGRNVPAADIRVRRLRGGQRQDGVWENYQWEDAAGPAGVVPAPESHYAVQYDPNRGTVVTLWNSPLRHGAQAGINGGLYSHHRLYGLEYIPGVVGSDSATFANDLTELTSDVVPVTTNRPKNTARWTIELSNLADGLYTVETRIGHDLTTGPGNNPSNVSKTYIWHNVPVPETEKYQFLGDPRHSPYGDAKQTAGAARETHKYNWYFRQVPGGVSNNTFSAYQSFDKATDGWQGHENAGAGKLNIDVPRYFQMFRRGLRHSWGLWNGMTGFSFYYVGLGGEMGADAANGFSNGLPIRALPWDPDAPASRVANVDEITANNLGANGQSHTRVIARQDGWASLPWLGELYPDDVFVAEWKDKGNLPTGHAGGSGGDGEFLRGKYTEAYDDDFYGNDDYPFDPVKRTNHRGAASFFNSQHPGHGDAYMMSHEYRDGNWATIDSVTKGIGTHIASAFNFPLPGTINAGRPWTITTTAASRKPPERDDPVYGSQRNENNAEIWRQSYQAMMFDAPGHPASALNAIGIYTAAGTLRLAGLTSNEPRSYYVLNGVAPQNQFGTAQIGKLCLSSLIYAGMSAGNDFMQVPLASISRPTLTDEFNDPSQIEVQASTVWRRWDGQIYANMVPPNYFPPGATLLANVKYSADNGRTWWFANASNQAATLGVLDVNHLAPSLGFADTVNAGNQTYSYAGNWDVSSLPEGNYILRIEVYRTDHRLHYAYHQRRIYINR